MTEVNAKSPPDRNRISRDDTTYTLGPLPWSEKVLRKAYFHDLLATRKAITEHPGFAVHRDLVGLRFLLDSLIDSVADLMKSIDAFRIESRSPEFWYRCARGRFEECELAIRRGIYTAVTIAMSLAEHSRKLSRRVQVPGYQERKDATFANDERHRLIQDLRDLLYHERIIEPDLKTTWSLAGERVEVVIKQDTLLMSSDWNPLSKKFIAQHPEGIDVEILLSNYRTQVEDFHNWFQSEVQRASEPNLSQYREYERILNRLDTNAWWNLILKEVVIKRGLNPYKYLDRYFTKVELDEVLSLPMRSKKQVDRIIEMLDDYGACDGKLREVVYKAFGVDVPGYKT